MKLGQDAGFEQEDETWVGFHLPWSTWPGFLLKTAAQEFFFSRSMRGLCSQGQGFLYLWLSSLLYGNSAGREKSPKWGMTWFLSISHTHTHIHTRICWSGEKFSTFDSYTQPLRILGQISFYPSHWGCRNWELGIRELAGIALMKRTFYLWGHKIFIKERAWLR